MQKVKNSTNSSKRSHNEREESMNEEQVIEGEGAIEESTGFENSQPEETLSPESDGQETPEQSSDENSEGAEQAPEFDPEAEQTLEFNGKSYTLKGNELASMLENAQALAEKEKSLNRDYTQKTQELGEVRKSFESAFGGKIPERDELQALGKVYDAYFKNPEAQRIIDAVISGNLDQINGSQTPNSENNGDPVVKALQQEIMGLKSQLSQFTSNSERKEQERLQQEGQRAFESWRSGKENQGQKVPDELIDPVLETAGILLKRNPSWDTNKALDEALRRETVDQIENSATRNVLKRADKAKTGSIKITPKAPTKSDSSKSYSEIFEDAM